MIEPRMLGDYTLIKLIGHGSMGAVYLAEHRFMKKQHVLKLLPSELSSDRGFIQRFEEDVSFLTTLDHPHIAKIHNVSFSQGQYFLVTDCVVDEFGETTNLAQYMLSRGNKFDEETLFRLLRQLAEALDYAHSKKGHNGKGLTHRTIKLNNILVAKGRGSIDLVLTDFGLSRIIGTGAVLTRTFKAVADVMGIVDSLYQSKPGLERYPSPPIDAQKLLPLQASFLQNFAFLAPEQKKIDNPHPLDVKVDAYAFGILAYYLLTGEFPEGIFDMPSTFRTESTWDWDSLITDCLQANPERRPESLVDALDAVRQLPKQIQAPPQHFTEFVTTQAPIINRAAPVIPQNAPIVQDQQFANVAPQAAFETASNAAPITSTPSFIEEEINDADDALVGPHDLASDTFSEIEEAAEREINAPLRPMLKNTHIDRPVNDLDPAAALIVDTAVKHYTPERREVKNIQPLQTEMIVINGGNFYRGSTDGNRDESPRHLITLSSYAIDTHPVTNEQFVRFLEVMGGEKDSNHQDIIRMRDSRIKRSGGRLSIESGYSKHPVVGVTWYGAIAYAMWVGKRLPTEAEWEIAARGGLENLLYPTGEDIEKTQANFFSSDTTTVMSYAPNGYGLFDMAGNVYEWCYDWYGYNYYEASVQEPEDPKGPLQGVYRVLRGGCWKSLKEDLRCSRRHRNNPGTVNGTYGFRCAADVQ
jgi:formylglycine-generating enzyme required for sulfatase activity